MVREVRGAVLPHPWSSAAFSSAASAALLAIRNPSMTLTGVGVGEAAWGQLLPAAKQEHGGGTWNVRLRVDTLNGDKLLRLAEDLGREDSDRGRACVTRVSL